MTTADSPIQRLEALGAMAAEIDAANPTPEAVEAAEREEKQAAAVDAAAQAWGIIPYTIGNTLSMIAPELRDVYTQERCMEWGEAAAAVARKYGWDTAPSMPELALAACTINMALPSALIVREKLREMREGKASGLLARLGAWWRMRKAARAAKDAAAKGLEGAPPAEAHGTA